MWGKASLMLTLLMWDRASLMLIEINSSVVRCDHISYAIWSLKDGQSSVFCSVMLGWRWGGHGNSVGPPFSDVRVCERMCVCECMRMCVSLCV